MKISITKRRENSVKKERIFYLDFIRAIATIGIILTHYNALFVYNTSIPMPEKAVITLSVGNIYIGGWGVSLFLIISGASLMYVYENHFDNKAFLKKRLINIFPMFWIAYVGALLFNFYSYGAIDTSIGKWRFIFSVLGIDSFLGNFAIPSFYLVGEWFLAYILMVYILFPILRKGVMDYPIVLAVIAGIMYVISIVFLGKDVTLFARLPEFLFGMYFMKYIKKINWKIALISFVVVLLNSVIKPDINYIFQYTYIGVASYLILVYCSKFFDFGICRKICSVICKYSYPCFIIHHYLIFKMVSKFDLNQITVGQSYLLFCCCVVMIAVFSYLLLHINDKIMQLFKGEVK